MESRPRRGLLAAAGLAAALALPAGASAQPDLVPQLNFPMNATVGVQNLGTTASGPSHLIINCTAFGQADGGCPDAPGMAAYADPAFPDRAVIDVPALQPNESFGHDLTFWDSIPWVPGTFVFDAEVDPNNLEAESNEANNTTQSSHTELPAVGVAQPAPLPLAAPDAGAKPVRPSIGKLTSRNIFQLKRLRAVEAKPSLPATPQLGAPQQPAEPLRLLRRPTR